MWAVIGVNHDVVDIVVIGIPRRLEIGRNLERYLAGHAVDVEQSSIGPGQGVGNGTVGRRRVRISGVGVIDYVRCGGIFSLAPRRTGNEHKSELVYIVDGDGEGLCRRRTLGPGLGDLHWRAWAECLAVDGRRGGDYAGVGVDGE